jgi:hypothetical protein
MHQPYLSLSILSSAPREYSTAWPIYHAQSIQTPHPTAIHSNTRTPTATYRQIMKCLLYLKYCA